MNRTRRRLGYGVVLLATAGIMMFRWLFFDALVGRQFPFVLFMAPVVAAAWIGGLRPGLAAVTAGTAVGVYFYTDRQGLLIREVDDWVRVVMFLTVGGIVSVLAESMQVARFRLAARQQQLEAQERQLAGEQQRRHRLEAQLFEREERFCMAVQSADIGTWDLNVLTGERAWSDRTRAMFGIGPDADVSAIEFENLLHPDDRDRFRQAVQAALDPSGDGGYCIDYRACRADGNVRWVVAHGQAYFQAEGNQRRAVRFIGTVLDITDRKAMEESLHEANRRKDQFLATLAHELRNPLAPITNALETWPFVTNDPAKIDGLRKVMARQVRQLTRLTDDLLDVSRIKRGTFTLHREHLDLTRLVTDVGEQSAQLMGSEGPRLTCTVPAEPVMVEGDVVRLTQVLENLLQNATKFTDRHDAIRVTLESRNEQAVISVADNGVGMPKHLLGEVFQLFRQLDAAAERSRAGLGIGLHLVKQIVELHGGRVSAHSEGPGMGSEFRIALPLATSPALAGPQTVAPETRTVSPLKRRKVLVVDDLPEVANSLATLLEVLGHEVLVAFDGPAAVESALAENPDLVFLDIAMPGMNGYEVAQALRAHHRPMPPVLVAITGRDQPQDRRRSLGAGFDHHLTKPTTLAELQAILGGSGMPAGQLA
jgi:PAS domain S-box-containing protein